MARGGVGVMFSILNRGLIVSKFSRGRRVLQTLTSKPSGGWTSHPQCICTASSCPCRHAGDLGNLVVDINRQGALDVTSELVFLYDRDSIIGRSVVVSM